MSRHIALLRAVNVGSAGRIRMDDLRAMAEAIGFSEVRTLLQSGNLVFEAGEAADRESRIEAALAERFGLKSAVMIRSAAEWMRLLAANPFPDAAEHDPSHLLVMPLKTAPAVGAEAALQAAVKGRETVRVIGQTAYLVYPDGIGDSKLTATVIERALGAVGTARNWNTVTKLLAMVFASPLAKERGAHGEATGG
jgi:uncharacterized protein (DUF1697 family)